MKLKYEQIVLPLKFEKDFEKTTVEELHKLVEEFTSVPSKNQAFSLNGKPLKFSSTSTTLEEEKLNSSDTLVLSIQSEVTDTDSSILKLIKDVKENYSTGKTLPMKYRLDQLTGLKKMMEENQKEFKDALFEDLKHNEMVKLNEILLSSINEIDNAIANLYYWMQPTKQSIPMGHQPGSGYIYPEPFGVVLLISPWNYPVSLVIKPLVGVISAGNACVIKPSEVSGATSKVFAKLIPKYLDSKMYVVIEGGPKETTTILKEQFDYIFYTGSTGVGKIIMEAAAKHLTPVTLELGGKSPCIVLKDCDIDVAVKRITWGKFFNCGQTCIAPDYVLIDESIEEAFCKKMKECIIQFYGENPQKSEEYSRIISKKHTERLSKLIPKDCYYGGVFDVEDKYISPTIVRNIDLESDLMKEEIFGPILPILPIKSLKGAISFINQRDKPLALYVFTSNDENAQIVINNTSSGAVEVNENLMHFNISSLPFGGVGKSGIGAYNGKYSFDTFSHSKSVLFKSTSIDPSLRYPPYTKKGLEWLKTLSNPTVGGFLSTLFQ